MIIKGLSRIGVFFLYLLSLLPFWFLYLLSDVLYFVIYYLTGYRKKVVRENLRNSFPEKTDAERRAIERKFYSYLCDLMLETIKMLTISKKQVLKRMALQSAQTDIEINKIIATGRPIIGAVGHYGNWELAALRFSFYTDVERVIVYKPLRNETYEKLFKHMRQRFGATLVAMKDILRKLIELRGKQTFTMLVSDQTPIQESVQYFTEFLNQPTAVFMGVEKLAKSTNAVVVFCDVRCVKRGYYTFSFALLEDEPKNAEPHAITNKHVAYLENMIKLAPQYWLWSHRRWKFKPKAI
ncbi:KDO2-lipid IV(A) lauroyltransferase [Mucilaginibacter yixingensis]|uniref:KDO2-lipid IV(A) lauroyltransferase n=1 Tax=Mucilaginibacter yixingensis TaxID=1295612 RepID=A0A2T5JA50_9SPHI|nr:lysophospholipid acyltransferase family protein [Mucilaginibacter yixingensis]PTQ96942.1 KDO2-lipid IV(A) lauroyltransferase [Mucilaginibacter yixingensis]